MCDQVPPDDAQKTTEKRGPIQWIVTVFKGIGNVLGLCLLILILFPSEVIITIGGLVEFGWIWILPEILIIAGAALAVFIYEQRFSRRQ